MAEKPSEWSVTLPIKDLVALLNFSDDLQKMKDENKQLRREMEGLQNMFSEVCQQFGDVKRELKRR